MTFEKLAILIERYNIPHDVEILSDSGWECNATNMDGIYYSKKEKTIIFTQGTGREEYFEPEWELIWTNLTRGNINNYFCIDTKRGNQVRLNSEDFTCSMLKEKLIKELKDNNEFEHYYGIKETQENLDYLEQNLDLCQPLYWTIQVLNNKNIYEDMGYIGLNIQGSDLDSEIYIFRQYRNKGYGKAVLKTLVDYAFDGRLKIYNHKTREIEPFRPKTIKATVRVENIACQALMESCGFKVPDDFAAMMIVFDDDCTSDCYSIECVKYICE